MPKVMSVVLVPGKRNKFKNVRAVTHEIKWKVEFTFGRITIN